MDPHVEAYRVKSWMIQRIVHPINNRQNYQYLSATHTLRTCIRNSVVTTFIPGGRTTYYTGLTYQDKSERLSSESLILRGTVIFSNTRHRCVELVDDSISSLSETFSPTETFTQT